MDLYPGPKKRRVASEVKLAELDPIRRALHENEDWYRDLVEHSQDLLCIHDLEGRLLSVNPAPARVLGYSVEEMLRIPMQEMVAPEFRAHFDAYLSQIASTGESRGLMAVMTRTGERRIWEYHNTLRREGVENPIVRGMARDVTEQKRAEKVARAATEAMVRKIAEQEQTEKRLREYERVVEDLEEMIVVVDRDYRYLIVNRAFANHRGMEKEQLVGRLALEQLREEGASQADLALVKQNLDECVLGKVVRYEMRYNYPGLGERDLLASYFPIEGPKGVDRIACVLRDVTERKKADEALRANVTQLQEVTAELRVAQEKLSEEKLYLEKSIGAELGFGEIVGHSAALKEVMAKVARVAPSDATVLLLGETGTGKELVARALHRMSNREGNSFIKLNCAAIPSGLVESELFGHERGAFTGAVARKLGRLELADRGTLFLDEIGEIPLTLQPKLLRVLQDLEFERLGGTRTLKVNFRLLAATNRDLLQSVKMHEFRSDLYYRLNVFPILLPPLRERREDIRPLVEHFVHKFASQMKKSITSIPSRTMEMLVRWEWPGNIRELENYVERSVILTSGSVLQAPLAELEATAVEGNDTSLRGRERERILRILQECRGKLGGPDGAAARLGLKRTTLQSRLDHLGIRPGSYRA